MASRGRSLKGLWESTSRPHWTSAFPSHYKVSPESSPLMATVIFVFLLGFILYIASTVLCPNEGGRKQKGYMERVAKTLLMVCAI